MAKKGFEIFGFDGPEVAVSRARQLVEAEGLEADLKVLDMLKPLPYPDEFFDAVLATRVILHTLLENVRRVVLEIDRVLKLSGYLSLQVPEYGEHQYVLKEASKTHVVTEPGTHAPLEGVEEGVPHHCFTKEELLGMFPNFTVEDVHLGSEHYRGYCLLARKVTVTTRVHSGETASSLPERV